MLRTLNKLSGFLLGIILYPLKSLFVNFLLAMGIVFIAGLVLTIIPALVGSLFYDKTEENKLPIAILSAVLTNLGLLIIVPPATVAVLIALAVESIKDIFSSARLGATEGYNEGLFYHVFKQALIAYLPFSRTLQRGINALNRNRTLNEEGLNNLRTDDIDFSQFGEDVPRSGSKVPDLFGPKEKNAVVFTPLTPVELQSLKGIVALQATLDRYTDLLERLTTLEQAMSAPRSEEGCLDYELVQDELTYTEMKTPCLIVKFYEYKPQPNELSPPKWKVVPGTTKITDFDKNLTPWLTLHNNAHPLFRDEVDNPADFNGCKTKYHVFPYKELKDSHELRELTATIRKELSVLDPRNIPSAPVVISEIRATLGQTFFGDTVAPVDTQPDANQHASPTFP